MTYHEHRGQPGVDGGVQDQPREERMSVPLDLYTATPQELRIGLLSCGALLVTIGCIAGAVVLLVTGHKVQRRSDRDE